MSPGRERRKLSGKIGDRFGGLRDEHQNPAKTDFSYIRDRGAQHECCDRTALLGNLRANRRAYPYHGYPWTDEGRVPVDGYPRIPTGKLGIDRKLAPSRDFRGSEPVSVGLERHRVTLVRVSCPKPRKQVPELLF